MLTGQMALHKAGLCDAAIIDAFLSPTRLAASLHDCTVKIWDVDRGLELMNLRGHTQTVRRVACSRDGWQLATTSHDQTARIWCLGTGKCLHTLIGHQSVVIPVAFSLDGSMVATGASDGTVRVWLTTTGVCSLVINVEDRIGIEGNHIFSVAFSSDDVLLVIGSLKGVVQVYDLEYEERVHAFCGHESAVLSVAWDVSGDFIASGSSDGTARIWDTGTCKCVWSTSTADDHGNVQSVTFSPLDTVCLLVSYEDGTVLLCDLDRSTKHYLHSGSGFPASASFTEDGQFVLVCCRSKACIYSVHTFEEVRTCDLGDALNQQDARTVAL